MNPLLVYTPSLAFSQVTGINLHYITPILVIVCIFYTTFGGLRWAWMRLVSSVFETFFNPFYSHSLFTQSCRLLWYTSIFCNGSCHFCCDDPGNSRRWRCWKSVWDCWRGKPSHISQVSEILRWSWDNIGERTKILFLYSYFPYPFVIPYFISACSLDFDPFVRSTFWMVSCGLTTMWISNVGA